MSAYTPYLASAVALLAAALLFLKWFKPKKQPFQQRPFNESFLSSDPSLWLQAQLDLANQKIEMAHHRLNDLEESYSSKESGEKSREVQSLKNRVKELEKQLAEFDRAR